MKKTIIIIILILAICCIGTFIYINNKGMSKEEFIILINSYVNTPNVKIEEQEVHKSEDKVSFETTATIYIKDNVMLTFRENVSSYKYIWSDLNTKKSIHYDKELKEYVILDNSDENVYQWDDVEYVFKGYGIYKGTICAIGELKVGEIGHTTTMWVDVQKGTTLKTINKGIDSMGEEYEIINEYTPTYGVVTDEDVQRPNLEGYTQMRTE